MIFVECDPDLLLVKSLTKGKDVVHTSGKPRVCNRLVKSTHCIGMVDEDPLSTQHPYINKLEKSGVKEELLAQDLKVLHDNRNNNHIILLCPRLEDWILKAVQATNIEMKKYHLSDKPGKLHDALTLAQESNMENFRKLLADLAKNSTKVKTLRELLEKSS